MEEGIVRSFRVEYSGVYELGDIGRIGLGFVNLGSSRGFLLSSWVEWARQARSGTSARAGHGRKRLARVCGYAN